MGWLMAVCKPERGVERVEMNYQAVSSNMPTPHAHNSTKHFTAIANRHNTSPQTHNLTHGYLDSHDYPSPLDPSLA